MMSTSISAKRKIHNGANRAGSPRSGFASDGSGGAGRGVLGGTIGLGLRMSSPLSFIFLWID